MSYIPDFETFCSRDQKLWPFMKTKSFFTSLPPKTGKNNRGLCEFHFFFKIDFNCFFTTSKCAQILKFVQNWQRQKLVKNQF